MCHAEKDPYPYHASNLLLHINWTTTRPKMLYSNNKTSIPILKNPLKRTIFEWNIITQKASLLIIVKN